MNKTPLILRVEEKIGEQIETFLPKMYKVEWKSSNYLGKMFGVNSTTVLRWLVKLGVKLRKGPEDYLEKRIKKPPVGALKYYYEFARKPVAEIAKERGVFPKTFYRWLDREGIERRKGSEIYLRPGIKKPSIKKLTRLFDKYSQLKIAQMYGVNPLTIRRWKQKAGLYKFRKSKYDNTTMRIKHLSDLVEKSEKDFRRLRYNDFQEFKQSNGNSYRGLLNWYISHYNCEFNEVKKYMKRDFSGYDNKDIEKPVIASKSPLESSLLFEED